MLVLGIDSSTPVASVALVSAEGLLGEITLNIGLTHSEQLLPLIDDLLHQTRKDIAQVEGIAVSGGPGSFTGLRIGMATAKGLAQGRKIPLVSVSTLLSLAYQAAGSNNLVSPVMNARKGEVYTALYRFSNGKQEQLLPEQAIRHSCWSEQLKKYNKPIMLIGDGALPYWELWQSELGELALRPPEVFSVARASATAWLGRGKILSGEKEDLYKMKPAYIRLAEAQVRLMQNK